MKTVAVIGIGPSGLCTVKELREAGLEVKGFDRSSTVGGIWRANGGGDRDDGVWDELCLNLTRRLMEFSDFPWPDVNSYPGNEKAYAGLYPHCTEASAYLEDYAKHFDLYPSLELETEVESVEEKVDGWIVTVDKKGETKEHSFDALVVCSGVYSKPWHPLQKKFKSFSGDVIHSQQFHSAKDYKGKRICVIGSSVSGTDISCVLAKYGDCKKVVNSVRHVPYHVSKLSTVNETPHPYDNVLYIRLPAWLGRFLPDSIASQGLKTAILESWPDQLADEPDIRVSSIALSEDYMGQVKSGRIEVKSAVSSANGNIIVFDDGTEQEFDVVICGTGYESNFSFLPKPVQEKILFTDPQTGKQSAALYKHTLVPSIENLAFAGIGNVVGSAFAFAEMQARYIAAVFSGKIVRPSDAQLSAGVATAQQRICNKFALNKYDQVVSANEDLGDELGVTPSYAAGIWNAKKILMTPVYSCYYRTNAATDGEDKAQVCRERFEQYVSNSQVPILE